MMFLRSLLAVIRSAIYGWILAIIELLRGLQRQGADKRDERDKRASRSHCVPIDRPEYVRPDPLIYSQQFLMDQGLSVTWDNPDIVLFEGGNPVPSHELKPGTRYEVRSRIWNDSMDCPVVAMKVHLSYLDFGIGTTPIPVGTASGVFIGVKGTANNPAFVSIPWRTPDTPGHYCLQVSLDPVEDRLPANNLGQENTDVGVSHSPVDFTFTLRNDTRRQQRYRFEVDGYAIGRRPPCRDDDNDRERRLERHRRGNQPLPAGFAVAIDPDTPSLAPGETTPIHVRVTPPGGFVGTQPVNVTAYHDHVPAGGVTLTVVGEA